MNHTCKNCWAEFEGRRNKTYCSIKCKSEFNNEKARVKNLSLVSAVKKLKLNEGILAALYSLYQDEAISYNQIRNSGFSFHGISGLDRYWNPIVLGYILIKIDNNNFKIEKWSNKNS